MDRKQRLSIQFGKNKSAHADGWIAIAALVVIVIAVSILGTSWWL